jgi:hypothetical protein
LSIGYTVRTSTVAPNTTQVVPRNCPNQRSCLVFYYCRTVTQATSSDVVKKAVWEVLRTFHALRVRLESQSQLDPDPGNHRILIWSPHCDSGNIQLNFELEGKAYHIGFSCWCTHYLFISMNADNYRQMDAPSCWQLTARHRGTVARARHTF